jgi:hypothetical protein
MNKHRSRFYWEANGPKRKYHWVVWSAFCSPKTLGGLGITDTKIMNICLMVKWIWRVMTREAGLCAEIVRYKYHRDKDLLLDSHRLASQFWNAIQKLKLIFSLGAKHHIGDGRSTRLWLDWWKGTGPLRDCFRDLFAITMHTDISVARAHHGGEWPIQFRRALGGAE